MPANFGRYKKIQAKRAYGGSSTPLSPFVKLDTAPSSPTEGWTYYDTVLQKVRTWNGTTWNNHW
jgi:hypothetical protein